MRKAQLAFEFLLLVAVAFLIMIVFSAATRVEFTRADSQKEHALVKDMAFSLQSEINRVSQLENGYSRRFRLDLTLDGYPYNATIEQNTLFVRSENYEYPLPVVPVIGNFTVNATNTIRKTNGVIYLNQ